METGNGNGTTFSYMLCRTFLRKVIYSFLRRETKFFKCLSYSNICYVYAWLGFLKLNILIEILFFCRGLVFSYT